MGAFSILKQPQRESNLRMRLGEYLPVGLMIGAALLCEILFALGVLWHPEADDRSRVVAALVAAAREPTAVPR